MIYMKEKQTDEMAWPRAKEGKGGHFQEYYVEYESAAKENRGTPNKTWLDIIRDDMKAYNMTEDMAHNRSMWQMKINTGSFLHG